MQNDAEIVIVGAGIMGAATAYYLSKIGKEVLLIEKDIPAYGTSSACDGTIFVESKPVGPKLDMAMEGVKIYSELESELGADIGFKAEGGIVLIETEEELRIMKEVVRKQRDSGLPIEMIDAAEVRKKQPWVSDCVIAGAFCPIDVQVNPIFTTLAYVNAAKRLGCKVMKKTGVTGIVQKNKAVAGVETDSGTIRTKCLINAAGINAPDISKMVGLDTPIIPRKGEILVTEQLDPVFKNIFMEARYIAIKHNPKIVEESNDPSFAKGVGLILEQTTEGNILLGSSREFVGVNKRSTADVLEMIAKRATHFFPRLKNVSIIRTFAGLRPYTPDGLPYVGTSKNIKGYVIVAGHEGDGIALAPETGRRVADLVANGNEEPLLSFSPDRLYR